MTDKKVWFIAGADSISLAEQKVTDLHEQINAFRDLSASLALDAWTPKCLTKETHR
jgi:hypothetical protein